MATRYSKTCSNCYYYQKSKLVCQECREDHPQPIEMVTLPKHELDKLLSDSQEYYNLLNGVSPTRVVINKIDLESLVQSSKKLTQFEKLIEKEFGYLFKKS